MRSGVFQILVGIDFSDSSARAMYHAVQLAERLGAVLHFCHITQPIADLPAHQDLGLNLPRELTNAYDARTRLERMRAMLCSSLAVDLHLRVGSPVQGLLELVDELKPDLLVVGSHGHGAVMRMLLGSVSTALTHRSPVPVLVVPAPGHEWQACPGAEPIAIGPGDAFALAPGPATAVAARSGLELLALEL